MPFKYASKGLKKSNYEAQSMYNVSKLESFPALSSQRGTHTRATKLHVWLVPAGSGAPVAMAMTS